ncbi:MAG: hypothetical protein KBH71_02020 [Anaerolineae bacterium]|nr:hypothetical protein [Anaerolineae bacterium]
MATVPIVHMTLYKHGVGFFERRARLSGTEVTLPFQVEVMNDLLKSLTVIDLEGGQVLGMDYATPQTREEQLEGCTVRLSDQHSLYDLLVSLRGRRIVLRLDQGETLSGLLVGPDEAPERQPLATTLISVLQDAENRVQVTPLGRVQGLEILDEQGGRDLRFFLQTALSQGNTRVVTIRLTPGAHELSVRYVAPAPTWRVSYRLVAESGAEPGAGRALLQGWGLFDNCLEEDLQEISLSLVAGMPISFVYDLYTPFTPERPLVKEETRVAAAPVEFEAVRRPKAMRGAQPEAEPPAAGFGVVEMMRAPMAPPPAPSSREAIAQAVQVMTEGKALGELFQYNIGTPVTVGRGQSAMVPIIGEELEYRKDLLYNGARLAAHPVATLRFKNSTGLTLERGPVTVIEDGEYVGEAILPFTTTEGEGVVPYAVELGIRIREQSGSSTETRALELKGIYLQFEEWDVRWRTYQVTNTTDKAADVLIEHPRTANFEIFNTPAPHEQTAETVRFKVSAPSQGETTLKVQERQLLRRREELQKQSYESLQQYLQRGLLDRQTLDKALKLLLLWDTIRDYEKKLAAVDQERQTVYKAQQQLRENLQALASTGKEGELRARYVAQLEASEGQLQTLAQREAELKANIEKVKQEIEARLKSL